MTHKITSFLPWATFALSLAFSAVSCSNSDKHPTENPGQGISVNDSAAQAAPNQMQTAVNPENNPEAPPSNSSENSSAVKGTQPSGTSQMPAKPETSKMAQTSKPAETKATVQPQPGTPVSPPNPVEKPDVKVMAPPKPVQAPVAEKPNVVVAPQPTKPPPPPQDDWAVPASYRNKANPVKADGESLSLGKSLYVKHCASCHGKSGRGDGTKAAQLDTPCGSFKLAGFQSQSDGAIFYKIKEGRDDMPGFSKKIQYEEDIWSIVNYIRTLK